jgi:hypothetical protein
VTSFFHKIQSYFSADNDGRYIEIILKELSELHPNILCDFVYNKGEMGESERFTQPSFQIEYFYKGGQGQIQGVNRRADLAILDCGVPKVLIEIKFHDQEIKGQDDQFSQFEDYVQWTKAEPGRKAMVIALNPVNPPEGMYPAYWSDFSDHLKNHENTSEIAKLLRHFLQAKGASLSEVNTANLLRFLSQEVSKATNGRIQTSDGTRDFDILKANLAVLSTPFDTRLKKSLGEARQAASIDHSVSSSIDDGPLDVIRIFAQHVLTDAPRHWRLRYGVEFWGVNSDTMQCCIYASVWDNTLTCDFPSYVEIDVDTLAFDVSQKSVDIRKMLDTVVNASLDAASVSLNAKFKSDSTDSDKIRDVLQKLTQKPA